MASVYGEVLDEAERRNGDVLSRRLSLGFMKKMSFAFSTLMVWSFKGGGLMTMSESQRPDPDVLIVGAGPGGFS